jgi:SOS-response transcriptional repressor LexA
MREHRQPTLEVKYVPYLGEVGCGKAVPAYDNVYPFMPQDEMIPVALPANMRDTDAGVVTVRGLSLSDFGIFDGDQLLVKHRPHWRDIDEDTVCIVLIHSTGEVVAKRIERGSNTLILKASGGGIPDMEYGSDEVEIRSVVIKALFDMDTLMARAREAKVRLGGIGRRKKMDELTPRLWTDKNADDIPF